MAKTLLLILLVVGVVLGFMGCGKYNGFVQKDEQVNQAWSAVETQYQRRSDLVSQLVSTIKGSADFEQETLQSVIEARSRATSIQLSADDLTEENLARFQAAQAQLGQGLGRLLATAEQYPTLQTTSQFRDLQAQVEGTENRIAVARQRFNDAATDFNTTIRTFPNNFFAGVFGFDRRALFESDPGAAQAPEINFD